MTREIFNGLHIHYRGSSRAATNSQFLPPIDPKKCRFRVTQNLSETMPKDWADLCGFRVGCFGSDSESLHLHYIIKEKWATQAVMCDDDDADITKIQGEGGGEGRRKKFSKPNHWWLAWRLGAAEVWKQVTIRNEGRIRFPDFSLRTFFSAVATRWFWPGYFFGEKAMCQYNYPKLCCSMWKQLFVQAGSGDNRWHPAQMRTQEFKLRSVIKEFYTLSPKFGERNRDNNSNPPKLSRRLSDIPKNRREWAPNFTLGTFWKKVRFDLFPFWKRGGDQNMKKDASKISNHQLTSVSAVEELYKHSRGELSGVVEALDLGRDPRVDDRDLVQLDLGEELDRISRTDLEKLWRKKERNQIVSFVRWSTRSQFVGHFQALTKKGIRGGIKELDWLEWKFFSFFSGEGNQTREQIWKRRGSFFEKH